MMGKTRWMIRMFYLLLLLFSAVARGGAQSSVERTPKKSLLGIEVHYRFDKSRFELDYMDNELSLKRFDHVVDSIGLHLIDSVIVISKSSPEGVYRHNVNLSRQRAADLQKVVLQRHPELASRLFVRPEGESWDRLREYVSNDKKMKQTTIDQVLRVIDANVGVDTKKWRMQQLPIYRYLRQTYYPRLRNSVFCIVHFTEEIPVVEEDTLAVPKDEVAEPEVLPAEAVVEEQQPVVLEVQETSREPMLNVHTNLLYDLGTALNLGVEYYPHNSRWSVAANYTFPWWRNDKKHCYLQLIDGEVEVRRYFDKAASHAGHYLAAYGHANYYDFSFDAERAWQGEGMGFGLGYGYVWRPWKDKRWKLEASIRVGYYQSLYDPYHAGDPYAGKYYYDWEGAIGEFERRNHRFRWFGPTGVGLTLSYDLFFRKLNSK